VPDVVPVVVEPELEVEFAWAAAKPTVDIAAIIAAATRAMVISALLSVPTLRFVLGFTSILETHIVPRIVS